MVLKYSNLGEEMNLKIAQGKTLKIPFAMVNSNDTPYVLTGHTIRGQIRKLALDTVVIIDIVVDVTNAALGLYDILVEDEDTAAIPAGELITDEESIYQWELEMEHPDGTVRQLYYGQINVLREVSRV